MPNWTPYRSYPDRAWTVNVGHGAGGAQVFVLTSSGSNFTALADATSNPADGTSTGAGTSGFTFAPSGRYFNSSGISTLEQFDLDLDLSFLRQVLTWIPPLPWPVRAIGFEHAPRTVQNVVDSVTNLTLTFDIIDRTATDLGGFTPCDVTLTATPVPKASLGYDTNNFSDADWLAASEISDVLSGASLPAGTSSVTATATIPDAPSLIHVAPSGFVWDSLHLAFAFAQQASHAAPALGAGRAVRIDNLSVSLTVADNRYRFELSSLPPLRQFPRDDALGGAPRQGHGSRSVQASARQGCSGAYR